MNLANKLWKSFRGTSQIGDLEEAIEVARQALASLPASTPWPSSLLDQSWIFARESIRLDKSDQWSNWGLGIDATSCGPTPRDHPYKAKYLSNLANVLESRYQREGHSVDLDEALVAAKEALDATSSTIQTELPIWTTLAINSRLNERIGQIGDLEEAIELLTQALKSTPQNHIDRPTRLNNLGYMLKSRYERTGQIHDLKLQSRLRDRPQTRYSRGMLVWSLTLQIILVGGMSEQGRQAT